MKKSGKVLHRSATVREVQHPPQTLRLYEREGLLSRRGPKATPDCTQKRPGTARNRFCTYPRSRMNLAASKSSLNMRRKIELMQGG